MRSISRPRVTNFVPYYLFGERLMKDRCCFELGITDLNVVVRCNFFNYPALVSICCMLFLLTQERNLGGTKWTIDRQTGFPITIGMSSMLKTVIGGIPNPVASPLIVCLLMSLQMAITAMSIAANVNTMQFLLSSEKTCILLRALNESRVN